MLIICCLTLLIATVASYNILPNTLKNTLHEVHLQNAIQHDDNDIDCSTSNVTVSLDNLIYTLYNRKNQKNGIVLNSSSLGEVNPEKRTVFIIHGWGQNGTYEWITLMKDIYLNKSDANIIVLDWNVYARLDFEDAFCSVPTVGNFTGDLIYNLTKIDLNLEDVQINGFSLGGHISGFAGKRVRALTGSKIARINGLDAAGNGYKNLPPSNRLYKSDARFVQAIHTNSNEAGFAAPYATVDYYVNYGLFSSECGNIQRGCPSFPGVPGIPPSESAFCNHIRAAAYFIESMISDDFIGVECGSCIKFRLGLCSGNDKSVMGENCPSSARGLRYLTTNYKSPFAKGLGGT